MALEQLFIAPSAPPLTAAFDGWQPAITATQPAAHDGLLQGVGAVGGTSSSIGDGGSGGCAGSVAGVGFGAAISSGAGSGAVSSAGGISSAGGGGAGGAGGSAGGGGENGNMLVGAIRLLSSAIHSTPRAQWTSLYSAVVLSGPAGRLPGLRQRLESELRLIRNMPDMPRTLRPQLLEWAEDEPAAPPPRSSGCAGAGVGGGGGVGGVGVGGHSKDVRPYKWPVAAAETAAWRGAAAQACAMLRQPSGHGSGGAGFGVQGDGARTWVLAEHFRREPRYALRAALRAAGAPTGADATPSIGGHFGGSGLAARSSRGMIPGGMRQL